MKKLLIKNVISQQNGAFGATDIRIRGKKIIQRGVDLQPAFGDQVLDAKGCFLYPGLINGHDHLEFNLYPRLGQSTYRNVQDWAADLASPAFSRFEALEKIPVAERLAWSACKSLISGVTTVLHHNSYYRIFRSSKYPIHVFSDYSWRHSLMYFDQGVQRPHRTYFMMHAAEGLCDASRAEIDVIDGIGRLGPHAILIHGIAMNDRQVNRIIRSQTNLAWCPSSNLFLFGRTAPIDKLVNKTPILLGSDSTLSGAATLLDEMTAAVQTGFADKEDVLRMVTTIPNTIIGRGVDDADLTLLFPRRTDYSENIVFAQPADVALVIVGGKVRLADDSFVEQLDCSRSNIVVQGRPKWIDLDFPALRLRILKYVKKDILESNPLWRMMEAPRESARA